MKRLAEIQLIFLVGAPLSGIEWLHQGLSAQVGVASAGRSWLFTRPRGLAGLLETHPEAKTAVLPLIEQVLTANLTPADTHLIEATPAHIHNWPLIADLLPQARFIHMRRDGRDVAAALTSQPAWQDGIGRSLETAVSAWIDVQKKGEQAAKSLPERFLTVKYEDAWASPAAFWRQVASICKLPVWETAVYPDPPGAEAHGAVGQWRTCFSAEEQQQLATRLGLLLEQYGYDDTSLSPSSEATLPAPTPKAKPIQPAWGWLRRLDRIFSPRTLYQMQYDLTRWQTRRRRRGDAAVHPTTPRLHLGCGRRLVPGWLNVDLVDSEYDVDLAAGALPWADDVFDVAVAQHVIEHLELMGELIPLLMELHRVMRPGATLWLSCPDMEKVARSYVQHRMSDLWADKQRRWPGANAEREALTRRGTPPNYPDHLVDQIPVVQMLNDLFHQWGEHKNLYDFELLNWALTQTGFSATERVDEATFLAVHTDFPPRNDDAQTLFVRTAA